MSARLKPFNKCDSRRILTVPSEHSRCASNSRTLELSRLRPGSDVEPKMHDIGFLHEIFLALESQPAGLPRAGLTAILNVVIEGDDFGANEAALEIRVDHARGPPDRASLRAQRVLCREPGSRSTAPG